MYMYIHMCMYLPPFIDSFLSTGRAKLRRDVSYMYIDYHMQPTQS